MDVLTPRPALALAASAAVVVAAALACQAVIPESSYFDPNGITALAQFSDLETTPSGLTLTPGGLFFVQGRALDVVPIDGSAPPRVVHTFTGPPKSLVFDGADTLFACDPTGAMYAVSATTLADAGASPGVVRGCLTVTASADLLGYVTVADAGTVGDAGAEPVTLVAVERATGAAVSSEEHTFTPFDIGLASQGDSLYGTVLGAVFRYPPHPAGAMRVDKGACTLSYVGETPRPKLLTLAADGGVSLLVRGEDDLIHGLDMNGPCCLTLAECLAAAVPSVQPGLGDFTTTGSYVYWSDQNAIKRQPIADLASGDDETVVVTIGDSATPISELAADATAVYAAVGARILRVPLPASLAP